MLPLSLLEEEGMVEDRHGHDDHVSRRKFRRALASWVL